VPLVGDWRYDPIARLRGHWQLFLADASPWRWREVRRLTPEGYDVGVPERPFLLRAARAARILPVSFWEEHTMRTRLLCSLIMGVISCGGAPGDGTVGPKLPAPANMMLSCPLQIQVCDRYWLWAFPVVPTPVNVCACPAVNASPYPLAPGTSVYDVQIEGRASIERIAFPSRARIDALIPPTRGAARRLAHLIDIGYVLSDDAKLYHAIPAFRALPLASRVAHFSQGSDISYEDVLLALDVEGLGR
jgi:hypothetical protein